MFGSIIFALMNLFFIRIMKEYPRIRLTPGFFDQNEAWHSYEVPVLFN